MSDGYWGDSAEECMKPWMKLTTDYLLRQW